MGVVIELKNIEKCFGEVKAVDQISLSIEKGEIISFLGPSGCGKTTTLRMVAGLEKPTSGEILLHGKDIVNVPIRKRNMTMVFQNYALFPHMTIAENIEFGLTVRHYDKAEKRKKASELLRLVKLEGFEDRYPSQLSGGQQQRVALARALITEPNVLLLDEPFGALDKKLRETMQLEIRNILKSLHTTAIFVTHDQEEALVLSDRIVVMNNGHIEQMATPKDMYEKPETRFVSNFIGISNTVEGPVRHTEGRSFVEFQGRRFFAQAALDGPTAILTIRPERVEVHPKSAETENRICGVVENIKYLCTTIQYFVNVGADTPMIASVQNNDEQRGMYPVGTEVCLCLKPEDLVPVREFA